MRREAGNHLGEYIIGQEVEVERYLKLTDKGPPSLKKRWKVKRERTKRRDSEWMDVDGRGWPLL